MSAKKKPAEDELSVAQAMQLIRWDFVPEEDDSSFEVSTGAFFEEFPWDGDDDGEAGGTTKPKK